MSEEDPQPEDDLAQAAQDVSVPTGDGEGDLDAGEPLDAEGGGQSFTDRLLSTEPNPPLEQVESPWNPEEGGVNRVYRGIQKFGDIEGMPAILDIAIGVLEHIEQSDLDVTGDEEDGGEFLPADAGGDTDV